MSGAVRYPAALDAEANLRLAREGRRDQLIAGNLRLVDWVLREEFSNFSENGLRREDLRQEGRAGLVIAACEYDPERGTSFSTFATRVIHNRVLGAIRETKRSKRPDCSFDDELSDESEEIASLHDVVAAPVPLAEDFDAGPRPTATPIGRCNYDGTEHDPWPRSEAPKRKDSLICAAICRAAWHRAVREATGEKFDRRDPYNLSGQHALPGELEARQEQARRPCGTLA